MTMNEDIYIRLNSPSEETIRTIRAYSDGENWGSQLVVIIYENDNKTLKDILIPKYVYNDIFGDSELDREIKCAEDLLEDKNREDELLEGYIRLKKRVRGKSSGA